MFCLALAGRLHRALLRCQERGGALCTRAGKLRLLVRCGCEHLAGDRCCSRSLARGPPHAKPAGRVHGVVPRKPPRLLASSTCPPSRCGPSGTPCSAAGRRGDCRVPLGLHGEPAARRGPEPHQAARRQHRPDPAHRDCGGLAGGRGVVVGWPGGGHGMRGTGGQQCGLSLS